MAERAIPEDILQRAADEGIDINSISPFTLRTKNFAGLPFQDPWTPLRIELEARITEKFGLEVVPPPHVQKLKDLGLID